MPRRTLEDAWREIERLRSKLTRLDSARYRGIPRFAGVDLDGVAPGTYNESCGFQPSLLFFFNNVTAGTVFTIGQGFAVQDENRDGGIYQASTAGRRSSGGQWRQSSESKASILIGGDATTVTADLEILSFDPDGFAYTVAGGAMDVLRGFAVGY